MSRTDLVFRTVGERTAALALQLAIEHIRPARVEVIDGVRPFAAAVERQRAIVHDADQVVFVDADCLILEDLVPFLERNRRPYVDCFVIDRFRGRIHCGVHITRADVVEAMRRIDPPPGDPKHVLRPESALRNLALGALGKKKEFRNFDILHDHFQFYRDIFSKYALRELRSRTRDQRDRLVEAENGWRSVDGGPGDRDIEVATLAVEHARRAVPTDADPAAMARYIEDLPALAAEELASAGVVEKGPLDRGEVDDWLQSNRPFAHRRAPGRPLVFGIGLSRTGTRSLTMALHVLGWDTVHYPADATTFDELAAGRYRLSVLDECQGVTDITVAPFFAQIDREYPGSKFVLTVREREGWLRSCRNHWDGRSAFQAPRDAEEETYMNVRRLLRAAVYGCYDFSPERFSWVYDQHVRAVQEHFRGRPRDLLVLDVCGGQGWDELCAFLGVPVPRGQPFPHKGATLTKRKSDEEARASAAPPQPGCVDPSAVATA
jgi:hypothetical protein